MNGGKLIGLFTKFRCKLIQQKDMDNYYSNIDDPLLDQIVLRKIFTASFLNNKSLDLSGLQIDQIPIEILALQHLEYLNLANCNISTVHEELIDLPNLKELNLDGNPLRLESTIYLNKKPPEIRKIIAQRKKNSGAGKDLYSWTKTSLTRSNENENRSPINRANSYLEFTRDVQESPRQIQETIVVVLQQSNPAKPVQSPNIGGIEYLFLLVGILANYVYKRIIGLVDDSKSKPSYQPDFKEIKGYSFNSIEKTQVTSEIKETLAKGNVQEAIEKIKACIFNFYINTKEEKTLSRQILLIESNYNLFKMNRNSEIITQNEFYAKSAQTVNSLLEFSDNL